MQSPTVNILVNIQIISGVIAYYFYASHAAAPGEPASFVEGLNNHDLQAYVVSIRNINTYQAVIGWAHAQHLSSALAA